ncbi:MAG: HAD-IB family phosphatase [Alphaproteobacteria bacterium]|nr:HAD-IB family phosphatase [Alphaproteobacteria bacterium SS10]
MARQLAVFDLDNTLTKGDTLVPWLVGIAGRLRFARALRQASWARFTAPKGADRRTVFKEALQIPCLSGVPVDYAVSMAQRVAPRLRWKQLAPNALNKHKQDDVTVLVATGAARLAAEHFVAHRFGSDITVIGTELAVDGKGNLTGRLDGGNCVRQEKKRQVEAWIAKQGPFDEIWGYGNKPHDLPMLELVDHATIV